ncbi:MAG TPA: hypothetical protein VMR25_06385 [Planctomycetaceae bacterium]|jgi:hypothetical protein|nr:hypothetical protein [Planctomycetaceae bacterium]
MSALQGLISFPGLTTFKSAEYTASQGIAPGICTIEMPQELVGTLQQQGNLTFSYGDAYVTLYSCVVDFANIDRSSGGFIARVQILDRRWAWRFGYIYGHYNLPGTGPTTAGGTDTGNGTPPPIRPDTNTDPQTLASYCLQAMGETLYDVSALPNSSRPEIHWSFDNPAEALESLCESLGCRVVLDIPSNGVRVVTIGEGNDLPTGPVQWVSEGVNPPEVPSALIFVGGQTVQQGFIPLTAVGRDVSGAISPIANLSYAPPGTGWTNETIDFPSVTSEPAHTYAEESVYRWWQPSIPYTAPDGTVVTDANQFILYDRQIDTNLNPTGPSGATTQKPEILGYFDPCYAQVDTSLGTVLTYHGSIQIDQNRCLVITGDPLVDSEYGRNLPARIWLKTSFSIRAPANREPYRYTQLFPLPGSPNLTQPRVVRHDEVVLQVRGVYDTSNGITQTAETDNSSWVGAAANYYLQATADQYETTDSLDVPYVGIVPIQVDGAIQQVTYSIQSGEGGKTLTRASRNTEHSHYIPKYEKRRAQAANKAVTDKVISQQSLLAQTQQNTGQPFV